MLNNLKTDITLYVMSSESAMDDTVKKTLDRYKVASEHIKVEYKDTTLYPNFYQKFTDTAPSSGSIIVYNEKNQKSKVVDYSDIYVSDSSYYYYTGETSASEYDCEGQLDTAIAYVRSENTYKIYQIEGHDEAVLDSSTFGTDNSLEEIIEKYNCEIESVKLVNRTEITTDECSAVLLLGPEKDYTKQEAKIIKQYLKNGGNAIIGLENTTSMGVDKPNFYSILEEYNISVQDGIIAENNSSYYSPQYGPFYAFAEGITGYASGLTSYVFSPYSAALKETSNGSDEVTYTALASTSEDAVLKTDAKNATSYEKEKGDKEGPFDTVVYSTKTSSEVTSNVLVFGSVYSLSDTMDEMVQESNTQIVNNALSDFIDTDVETVSVPSKSMETTQLTVTESGSRWFGILIAVVLPVVILVFGIAIWFRRRKY
jgi:ABC-2 type transport system permease protein